MYIYAADSFLLYKRDKSPLFLFFFVLPPLSFLVYIPVYIHLVHITIANLFVFLFDYSCRNTMATIDCNQSVIFVMPYIFI